MPDEHVGFGPAALEHPESDSFATKEESLAEATPGIPESEPAAPEKGEKYEQLLSAVTQTQTTSSQTATGTDPKIDLAHLQTFESEEEKIEQLVKLAQTKGVVHAVQVATRLKDYYALDMFHDELVDNLYDALLAQGLITKE